MIKEEMLKYKINIWGEAKTVDIARIVLHICK